MVFASVGYKVSIYDTDQAKVRAALETIARKLKDLEKSGLLRGKLSVKQQISLVSGSSSLVDSVTDAIYIQESVFENLDVKREVLAEIDGVMNPNAILASSASALMPSKLSESLRHKERFVIAHPANPPYFVPIVELVPAPWTKPEVISKVRELMQDVGQAPVICLKEQNGFALCRMQYAVINECWRLVRDGYLDVEDMDTVMTAGLGRRYAFLGPFETAHLNAEGMESYLDRYGEMIYETSQDLGPPPCLDGATAKDVTEQLCKLVPLDDIKARQKWRDMSLAKLNKIRTNLDA